MKNKTPNFSEKLFLPILELIKVKKYDEALNLIDKFDVKDSDIVNRIKGSIYLNKKNWQEALACYQKISSKEKNFKILNNIGVCLYKLGKYSYSINEFNKSINTNNVFLPAYENLSVTYKLLGNYDLSTKYTTMALKLMPNNNKMKNNLLEIFNYYEPKNYNHLIIETNNEISKLDIIKNNKIIHKSSIGKILEKSEEILNGKNINFNYSETQIYRRNKTNLNCDRHFGIFNNYKIIPKYCFSCYKVQINLANILELLKLYFLFNNLYLEKNNIRKCMVELRKNIIGNYKGYLYAGSLKEAKALELQIKNELALNEIKFKKIEIKRGCTEFYEVHELYKNIDEDITNKIYQKNWDNIEKEFDQENLIEEKNKEKIYNNTINKFNLSDFIIIKNWLIYAELINDQSYKEIFKYNININQLSKNDSEKIQMRIKN